MPIVATKHDATGAKAFAEFFIKIFDWGYATMSGAYLRHYSDVRCDGCASFYKGIDEDRKKGYLYVGGRTSVIGVKAGKEGPLHEEIVSVRATGFELQDSDGRFLYGEAPRSLLRFVVRLEWTVDGWRVLKLSVIA